MIDQYTELCRINLDSLQHQPSSTLYKTLEKIKRPVFTPDERIVFSCYNPLDQKLLEHVFWCLDHIDIPLFFVKLESSELSVAEYFKSQDKDIIVEIVDAVKIDAPNKLYNAHFYNKNICPHPWIGYWVWPNGETSPCCDYSDRWENLNVKNCSHEDILYSNEMEELRNQFRNNQIPKHCKSCASRTPSRIEIAPYKLSNIVGHVDYESRGHMMFIGGNFGNLCNLKCRICSSEFSSQIAAEDIKHGPHEKAEQAKKTIKVGRWSKKSKDFWDYLRDTPTLKSFEFLGGEPFLLQELTDYIEHLVASDASKDCMFEIVTNGTVIPDVILKHHNKFKHIGITFSIDNIQQRFELERKNASWHKVNNNIQSLIGLKNVACRINTSVSVMNVYYLPELIEWWLGLGIGDSNSITLSIVKRPEHLSITHMPPDISSVVIKKLEAAGNQQLLQPVIDTLNNPKSDLSQEFLQYTKFKDSIRNENFADTHSEIAQLYNYK